MKIRNTKYEIRNDNSQKGQIVLILVLVTIVGLTIGLSLVSRTVTDIRMSSQIEQSNRAFSAAEAGVESALRGAAAGGPTGTVTLPGASANYSVVELGGNDDTYVFPYTETFATQTLWLAPHNDAGGLVYTGTYPANQQLDICWGSDEDNTAAIMITILYKDNPPPQDFKVGKAAYDVQVRIPPNNFQSAETGEGYCGGNFKFRQTITPGDIIGSNDVKLIALRIQPVYMGTAIAINPKANLPIQGKQITSFGQTETKVARKIQVTQGYNVLPSLFDYTLFTWNVPCP